MDEQQIPPEPESPEEEQTQVEPVEPPAKATEELLPAQAPDSESSPEQTQEEPAAPQAISMEELLAAQAPESETSPEPFVMEEAQLRAVLEAIVYVTEEPLTVAQISSALGQTGERIQALLDLMVAEFDKPEHGLTVREVAGGYKMATKAEHHDAVRNFVKSLKAPLKLSLPALETLAVIAYKQPVTSPEIMEIRGVQGAGVLKTLLDRKLISHAGRKNVLGKPILYKTTKEFLIQFGLKDLAELPSLKEFEEIRRMAFTEDEVSPPPATSDAESAASPQADLNLAAPEDVSASRDREGSGSAGLPLPDSRGSGLAVEPASETAAAPETFEEPPAPPQAVETTPAPEPNPEEQEN